MESLKEFFNSTPFKIAVGVLTAIFTAVRFSGLALPQYAQTIAVFGLVICVLFFLALSYHELLSRLVILSHDRSNLMDDFGPVKEALNELKNSNSSTAELSERIKSIGNDLTDVKRIVEGFNESPKDSIQLISDESLYESLAKKYGYANESVEIECLLDQDGSARVERRVTVRAFAKYDEIDTYLMVPEMLHGDGERTPRIIEAKTDDNNRKIEWRSESEIHGRTAAILTFFPSLVEGVLSTYSLIERTPTDTFTLEGTESELREKEKSGDPDEYFGWNINRPTKKLCIKVIFPEGFLPVEPRSQVRFATAAGFPSMQLQTEEQNKIMVPRIKPATGGRRMLYFEVLYPMTNLIYMLRWSPQLKQ